MGPLPISIELISSYLIPSFCRPKHEWMFYDVQSYPRVFPGFQMEGFHPFHWKHHWCFQVIPGSSCCRRKNNSCILSWERGRSQTHANMIYCTWYSDIFWYEWCATIYPWYVIKSNIQLIHIAPYIYTCVAHKRKTVSVQSTLGKLWWPDQLQGPSTLILKSHRAWRWTMLRLGGWEKWQQDVKNVKSQAMSCPDFSWFFDTLLELLLGITQK